MFPIFDGVLGQLLLRKVMKVLGGGRLTGDDAEEFSAAAISEGARAQIPSVTSKMEKAKRTMATITDAEVQSLLAKRGEGAPEAGLDVKLFVVVRDAMFRCLNDIPAYPGDAADQTRDALDEKVTADVAARLPAYTTVPHEELVRTACEAMLERMF